MFLSARKIWSWSLPHTNVSPKIRALLLSAGFGTRLQPLTNHLPKCLMPIGQKPILGWWLDNLLAANVDRVLVNSHYKADLVENYLKTHTASEKFELAYERELLGTAGTLKKHQDFFKDSAVLLIHGDNFSSIDLHTFYQDFQKRPPGCHITMATFITDTPKTCGIVETDSRGVVQAFFEKVENPPSANANGAVYFLDQTVLDFVCALPGEVLDFSTQVLPNFVGQINVSPVPGYHIDIGSVQNWRKANHVVATPKSLDLSEYYLRHLSIDESVISELEKTLDQQ